MDPSTHHRARELFEQAVDLAPDDRARFLDGVSGSDHVLMDEVRALLGADDAAGDEIGEMIRSAAQETFQEASTPVAAELLPMEHIGSYVIDGVLGRGGMGVVYRARDSRLERPIAIKMLSREFADDATRRHLFTREAQLLAALNHPNIATIYSLEVAEDQHFLTMELVEGESLAARLRDGLPTIGNTLSLVRQIASALETAHAAGIIHRDLKPMNVMERTDGLVKVLDFGLAKLIDDPDTGGAAGRGLGTPGYASPEQLRGGDVDHRSDIFALGCILYECLAGCPVHPGSSPFERAAVTLSRDPDWSLLPAATPDLVKDLLRNCLAREADQRTASIAQVRREIEEAIPVTSLPQQIARSAPVRDNLPHPLSSFVGREQSIVELTHLIQAHRLVTVTGLGGCGKTRLALELSARLRPRFPDGVWFIDLTRVTTGDQVRATTTATLGLGSSGSSALRDHLRDRRMLFLLDNCEHILHAAAEVATELLQASHDVRVLATSRERLAIPGEVSYPVPSLLLPPETSASLEVLGESDAVRLFLDRAQAAQTTFQLTEDNGPAVARICRRVDGIPLALELAAARIRALTAEELASRLEERFSILSSLGRTTTQKHETMRATLDWSHHLLSASERLLFRRLSTFTGGWTLAAAEEVVADHEIARWEFLDLHTRLVEKSLVELDASSSRRARYRMLETVREYARERLVEAEETTTTEARHRGFFLALAEEARLHLRGAQQQIWLDRLDLDHENLMGAVTFCVTEGDPSQALRVVDSLSPYWEVRGYWLEGYVAGRTALGRVGNEPETTVRSRVLAYVAAFAYRRGYYDEAGMLADQAIAMAQQLPDRSGLPSAHIVRGLIDVAIGRHREARSQYADALAAARELGDRRGEGVALSNLAIVEFEIGDYVEARRRFEESLALRQEIGDLRGAADSLLGLGNVANDLSEYESARKHYAESLALRRELGDERGIAASLQGLGLVSFALRDYAAAQSYHAQALEVRQDLGDRAGTVASLNNLGIVASAQGDHEEALGRCQEALGIARQIGHSRGIAISLTYLAQAELGLDHFEASRTYVAEALEIARDGHHARLIGFAVEILGSIAARARRFALSVRLFGASEVLIRESLSTSLDHHRKRDALDAAKAALGPEAFAHEWQAGQSVAATEAAALGIDAARSLEDVEL